MNYAYTTRIPRATVNLTTDAERYAAAKVNLLSSLPINSEPVMATLAYETSDDYVTPHSGMAIRASVDVMV